MKNLAVSEVLSDSHCNSNVNNCGNESYAANIFFMTTVSRLHSHFEEITFFSMSPGVTGTHLIRLRKMKG